VETQPISNFLLSLVVLGGVWIVVMTNYLAYDEQYPSHLFKPGGWKHGMDIPLGYFNSCFESLRASLTIVI
jgi:hypothetical protein